MVIKVIKNVRVGIGVASGASEACLNDVAEWWLEGGGGIV